MQGTSVETPPPQGPQALSSACWDSRGIGVEVEVRDGSSVVHRRAECQTVTATEPPPGKTGQSSVKKTLNRVCHAFHHSAALQSFPLQNPSMRMPPFEPQPSHHLSLHKYLGHHLRIGSSKYGVQQPLGQCWAGSSLPSIQHPPLSDDDTIPALPSPESHYGNSRHQLDDRRRSFASVNAFKKRDVEWHREQTTTTTEHEQRESESLSKIMVQLSASASLSAAIFTSTKSWTQLWPRKVWCKTGNGSMRREQRQSLSMTLLAHAFACRCDKIAVAVAVAMQEGSS
ncbi:hypothetical protein HYFRA_00008094 [Hymenoscyphus fraxineus]|uniref:Uncharacterized protein n=1 Tax=Hymenoscyphus fraxineus TaxID=746836 RepID=A0A9N9KP60_9HELO|nr:hypothetical protein HYFRA_00008094 [Hymenoscyphus fraxineus]